MKSYGEAKRKKPRGDARDALKRDEIMFHGAFQEDLVPLSNIRPLCPTRCLL